MDVAGSRIQDGRFSGSQDGRSPVGVNQSSFLIQREFSPRFPDLSPHPDTSPHVLKEAKKATILNGIISVAVLQAGEARSFRQAKNKFARVLKFLLVLGLLIDRGEIFSGFGGNSRTLLKWSGATE